jgi:CheY-like chemotaxis protein
MTVQILIVDDNKEFAQQVSELMRARTGLEAAFAADPDTAMSIVENNAVAVAVLDQKMPLMPGTTLYQKLKLVRPDLRAVMLTGEASADEVGETLKLGYDAYLSKGRIEELSDLVTQLYLKYLTRQATADIASKEVIWPRGSIRQWWTNVEVRLISSVEVDPGYVDPAGWKTVMQLNAGEERKLTYQVTQSRVVSMEEESSQALKSTLNLKAGAMSAAIASILEASSSSTRRRSVKLSRELSESGEQTLRLPTQSEQARDPYVRARHFQQADVVGKRIVTLQVRCRCCDIRTLVPIQLRENTGLVATRQEDYLSDGTVASTYTGVVSVGEQR